MLIKQLHGQECGIENWEGLMISTSHLNPQSHAFECKFDLLLSANPRHRSKLSIMNGTQIDTSETCVVRDGVLSARWS